MDTLKAQVKNGRLVLDLPTDLPEGTEVELVRAEDPMDAQEEAALLAALERSEEQINAGQHRPAREFLEELRRRG